MKFYGNIGFSGAIDNSAPGVWSQSVTIRPYYGDVYKNTRRFEQGASVNDDVSMNNEISVISDSYLDENLGYMKYVEWSGLKWKIASFTVEWPRVCLQLGGLYNG